MTIYTFWMAMLLIMKLAEYGYYCPDECPDTGLNTRWIWTLPKK